MTHEHYHRRRDEAALDAGRGGPGRKKGACTASSRPSRCWNTPRSTPRRTELLSNIDFVGNELAITGFLNNPDDVELQCANIRRMAAVGEVGLILFYVGVVMKDVDQQLIDVADALDFALICMPRGQLNQRYSEVICEVMELIHRDQMSGANLVVELLERAGSLPAHQRTVDSLLRMLADRLRASVVLMDSARRVLNEAAWPRSFDPSMMQALTDAEFPTASRWLRHEALGVSIYRDAIQTQDGRAMDLLIFREGGALDLALTRQAVEAVQLAVTIWAGNHDRVVIGELVRAILQDEPLKMRRLADIFHVDIASLNSMWLLSPRPGRGPRAPLGADRVVLPGYAGLFPHRHRGHV